MPGNYFYTNTSDANLAKELLHGCGELYIQKHEYSGTATLTLVPGGTDTLVLSDSGVAADDAYNSTSADNLYIVDDNGKCARGKVSDTFSESTGTLIEFEADDMVLTEDGATAPTLTDGTSYTVLVLSGSNNNMFGDYMGYMDDSVEFDPTTETDPLERCTRDGTMVEVAEAVNKRSLMVSGATFNVPNTDVISKVLNMVQYGLNTGQSEYHGGFSPDISTYYQLTILTKDWDGNFIAIQLFKGQLINNGALGFTGTGWKTVPWQFKGKEDTVRDSTAVNGFRFIKGFSLT
jgi:hypothetical protein